MTALRREDVTVTALPKLATTYDQDVVAWANEQAALLRAGRWSDLDIEHLADEIEDVGKSEQRELASRVAVLLAHLLEEGLASPFQPERRGKSWEYTIKTQRADVVYLLNEAPSLRTKFVDSAWISLVWSKAVISAAQETGIAIDVFPATCPWLVEQVLSSDFWPEQLPDLDDGPSP